MRRRSLWLLLVLSTAVLLPALVSTGAQAQTVLDFQLLNPSMNAASGSTLTFQALLTNTGSTPLFLNSDFGIVDPPLSVDDGKFIDAFLLGTANPLPADGLPHLFNLFDVVVPGGLAKGDTFHGSFTLFGGADRNAVAQLGAQRFDITINAVTPEANSLLLFASAIAALGAPLLWRKSRAMKCFSQS